MGREPNGQDRTATVKKQDTSSSEPLRTKKREKAGDQDGKISGKALGRTVEAFMRLPGIGRKSAERLAFAVLGMPKEEAAGIALSVAERLLGRTIGGDDQKRLADQYVRELGGKN